MDRNFFNVQTKLLAGFIGILILAGFAGITGVKGISTINYQNKIGAIVDDITEFSDDTQSASLRYIIYEDEHFYEAALNSAEKQCPDQ